ncbi:MAG: hypothetical protein ABIS68_03345 [Casimicrobiaceae bacterium]
MGAVSLPATVSAASIYLDVAPPAPRVEVTPRARAGHIWVPGYWNARHGRHVWTRGHWERARHGMHYRASRWSERGHRWHLERGRWARGDRDGDGVPNYRDRAPNNPRRQ